MDMDVASAVCLHHLYLLCGPPIIAHFISISVWFGFLSTNQGKRIFMKWEISHFIIPGRYRLNVKLYSKIYNLSICPIPASAGMSANFTSSTIGISTIFAILVYFG